MSLPAYILKGASKKALGFFNFVGLSTVSGITASTTQTLAGATQLSAAINVISTVATAQPCRWAVGGCLQCRCCCRGCLSILCQRHH